MTPIKVPMVDLAWQYEQCKEEIDEAVAKVLSSGRYILGPYVEMFEDAVAERLGVDGAIGVASGTDALVLALKAAGIRKDDLVVLPAVTFIATLQAVLRVGATPGFVDIDLATGNLDVQLLSEMRSDVRAILPVHLYGQCVDMTCIRQLASDSGAVVIEDAAQAFGATCQGGKLAGATGEAGCFSFFPTKPLGCCGDGGMVVGTELLLDDVDVLRRQGARQKDNATRPGTNSRLDELQAAILLAKLKRFYEWAKLRAEAAIRYDRMLQEVEGVEPVRTDHERSAHHLYVVKVDVFDVDRSLRAEVCKRMRQLGVPTQVHYLRTLAEHILTRGIYRHHHDLRCARSFVNQILSLPFYPGITEEQQQLVVDALKQAVEAQCA